MIKAVCLSGLALLAPVLLASALLVVVTPARAADSYRLVPEHTFARFSYGHGGLAHFSGKVGGAGGTLVLDPDDPAADRVDVSLDMSTLSAGAFGGALKGADGFDVGHFPTAHFESRRVEVTGKNSVDVTGDLTLHGVTKSVVMAVTFNRTDGAAGLGFSGTARLRRSDFGISAYKGWIDDTVDLHVEATAVP